MLKHCFEQLRSTQVAIVHCSAQTNPTHILQKLSQTCMVLNTNTGRVYRPKDCERLVLYLKDINLPKPDKWGTCQMIAFLQQVYSRNTDIMQQTVLFYPKFSDMLSPYYMYTVKIVSSGHSKKDQKLVFKTNYRLMQVKSIAECSNGSILQYFRPSLSYHWSLRFCLFLSGRFTQVLL